MYQPEIPDIQTRYEDAGKDFISVAGATLLGMYIGHRIDQTRFGVWANTNPTIRSVMRIIGMIAVLVGVGFACVFLYFLLAQF